MRRAHFLDDLLHLIGGVGEIARNVTVIDRLQHDREAALGRAIADLLEVRDESTVHVLGVGPRSDHARHDVQGSAFQDLGIVEGLFERGGKFDLAAGQGREPALALAPVARRQVEQRLGKLVFLELDRDLGCGRFVGEKDLHRPEAVRGGGAKPLQEWQFLVDPRQVGGELGHDCCPVRRGKLLQLRAPGGRTGCAS